MSINRSLEDSNVSPLQDEVYFDLHAGTTEFYLDPGYYDSEFNPRVEDVEFYTQRYLEADGEVLELGVGTGRIAVPAVSHGASVFGIDLHSQMLEAAQKRADKILIEGVGSLRLAQGDMRSLSLSEKFSMITCPFNALQHMYTNDDVVSCLQTILRHLKDGGIFIFDVLMPVFTYLNRNPFVVHEGIIFEHPTFKANYRYSERSAYDPVTQINQMWFYYDRVKPPIGEKSNAPEHHSIQLSHRYFFPMELRYLLETNGFEIIQELGGFENQPLREGCESMIFFCKSKN